MNLLHLMTSRQEWAIPIGCCILISIIRFMTFDRPSFATPVTESVETHIRIKPEWQKEMEQALPEWQKKCRFEDDFLLPLYKTSPNQQHDAKITLVSEFFNQSDSGMEAVRLNMKDNLHHGRFVFLIGDSKKDLDLLKTIAPLSEINMEVWYAPGGVTYRSLFAAATRYSGPFVVHNSDIGVGDMSGLLDACPNFDDVAFVGSRVDIHPDPKYPVGKNCTSYMLRGSFDAVVTNPTSFDCEIINALQFKHNYWGAENAMAHFLPKGTKVNLCPRWRFSHYHNVTNAKRPLRPYVNAKENNFIGTYGNDDVLGLVCDLKKLPPFEIPLYPGDPMPFQEFGTGPL
mmetsp:Transcript_2408/g.3538  ORF Transcript_2408/g.3538 Transcript_2408/m.3538 type:complete len:343 (+) Transcript_2408:152-1180(+)